VLENAAIKCKDFQGLRKPSSLATPCLKTSHDRCKSVVT